MDRRLVTFALQALRKNIEVKLKNGKVATGVLYAIDPYEFSISIHNYNCSDEKADFKILKLG